MKLLFLLPAVTAVNPVGQVLDLLQKLHDTVVKDGEVELKQFEAFAEWCEDQAKERQYEIKTGNAQADSLRAAIEKAEADIDSANSTIEAHSADIAANEQDLKAATDIRAKEHKAFKKDEAELVKTVDMLRRAQSVIKRELSKGASFAQMPQEIKNLISSLSVILDAAMFDSADRKKLQAFLQSAQAGVNAPEAAAYESHSNGILDTLADMQEKAEGILEDTRKTEVNSRHAFELLQQSLQDQLKVERDGLSNTKKQLAATSEVKGQAEGDLANTIKDLEEDKNYEKKLAANCQERAVDHEVSTKGRAEELAALSAARKIIAKATGAAASRQYESLVQVSESTDLYTRIEKNIKTLGRKDNSASLVQLAGQIRATVSMNRDVFAKVKGLIQDMIKKLVTDAQAEASHKAFCDKETSTNEAKRNKLQAESNKLSTRLEKAQAGIAALKGQIAELNKAVADIAASQKKMDGMRENEHAEYLKAKADFEQGVTGIRGALKVLRDFYASENEGAFVQEPATSTHSKSADSGNGIISLLEVAESDFARSLAEANAAEEDAVSEYEATTQENKVSTATKRTSAEGKTQESARLEQVISDATSDRDGVNEELSAVQEYLEKLRPQCTTEPESYESRKARREHEIEGLKSALEILENETALVQTSSKTHFLQRHQTPLA
jgi:chromosome segregation ATPase